MSEVIPRRLLTKWKLLSLNAFAYYDPIIKMDVETMFRIENKNEWINLTKDEKKDIKWMKKAIKSAVKDIQKRFMKTPVFLFPPTTIIDGKETNIARDVFENLLGFKDEEWYKSFDLFITEGEFDIAKHTVEKEREEYIQEHISNIQVGIPEDIENISGNRIYIIYFDILNFNGDINFYLFDLVSKRYKMDNISTRSFFCFQYQSMRKKEVPLIELY